MIQPYGTLSEYDSNISRVEKRDISWEISVDLTLNHEKKKENHLFMARDFQLNRLTV